MKQYSIEYSEEAKIDLIEIKKYIKYNLQEPNIAEKLINKLIKRIRCFWVGWKFLFRVQIDDEFIKRLEIRKIIVDNYIVFYRIKNNTIQIVRVLYGRRNWIKLL